ncbi:MAG: hypothetical protein J5I65_06660 [Aridibacter famidurans]|nr:hypothetical protein [Aridibacter famidurans]
MEKHRYKENETGYSAEIEHGPDEVAFAERRLNRLIELNAEYAALSKREVSDETHLPGAVGYERSFAILGLWTGILPPAAFFLRLATDSPGDDVGAYFLITSLVTSAAAATGYFTGKIVGKIVRELDQFSLPARFAMLPFVGTTWGILAGGAGGAPIFLFGAIPGAVIGAAAGCAALPVFSLLHSALRQGDVIERRHLYPSAIGVAATLAALILGFPA